MTFMQSVGYMIALIGVLFVSDVINQTVYNVRQSGRLAGSAEAATGTDSWLVTAFGSFGLALFYIVLTAWALFVAYYVVRYRQERATDGPVVSEFTPRSVFSAVETHEVRPDLFPTQYRNTVPRTSVREESVSTATARTAPAPANLPTASTESAPVTTPQSATTPQWESESASTAVIQPEVSPAKESSSIIVELEELAHQRRILTSADAIAYMLRHNNPADPRQAFTAVLDRAAATYPAEDGWVILNVPRMQTLLLK